MGDGGELENGGPSTRLKLFAFRGFWRWLRRMATVPTRLEVSSGILRQQGLCVEQNSFVEVRAHTHAHEIAGQTVVSATSWHHYCAHEPVCQMGLAFPKHM